MSARSFVRVINSFDVVCLHQTTFLATGYWRTCTFWRESVQFKAYVWVLIWQGTVVTFFRCGGQVHTHFGLISFRFCAPKFIISCYLKGKKWTFLRHPVARKVFVLFVKGTVSSFLCSYFCICGVLLLNCVLCLWHLCDCEIDDLK